VSERRVVVVGASLAGFRVAQGLRLKGFDGAVTLIGDEPHLPYDRPPLSKQYLAGEWEPDRFELAPGGMLDGLDLDLRLGRRAVDLDLSERKVVLHGGEPVPFDDVVIATGSAPRLLPGTPDLDGIHELRTIEDATAIRDALGRANRVVVVGAGFIGAEVAATARSKGLDVTVLEALPVPLSRGLGPRLGPVVAALHADHGVDLRTGAGVAGFEGDEGRVARVVLSDGGVVEADLVVVGIGTTPATDWLEGSGLELRDGVVCDATCRAVGADGVWAAGDVARWPNQLFGEEMRLEHWDNAAMQGSAVAASIASGEPAPFAPVPFVWSEQYDAMIQVLGRPHPNDAVEVAIGSFEERAFVALLERDGLLSGVVGMNEAKRTMRLKALLRNRPTIEEARKTADELR
jgi:NADPH-dependent 2,4-dienoyl-CoA reductase/sulfur reductase-like enzyme